MTLAVVLFTGFLIAGGLVALIAAFVPATPHLADTLNGLSEQLQVVEPIAVSKGAEVSRSDRLGTWMYRHSPTALTARQRQNLQIRNKAVAEFYAEKTIFAIIGALLPALVTTLLGMITELPWVTPALLAVLGVIIGYFVPDLLLRGQAKAVRSDAGEALLTFIDLVTLERLANTSATQSLHNAANLSEVPLFTQIRAALERARLEQQSPYGELRRLADQLNLPELTDVADIMQLDESGAALSGVLRARVRELRDAHLTAAQTEANAVSEGMTIYMTIPALIFGLIFMVPPLMRIVFG